MKLEPKYLEKVDPLLEKELTEARGYEPLRVIMVLDDPDSVSQHPTESEPNLHPSQFPNRKAYRQALIDAQEKRVANAVGKTRQALEHLSLRLRGGEISKTVVVDGSASQILAALELEGVRQVTLDQPLALNDMAQHITRIIGQAVGGLDARTEPVILKAAKQYFQTYYNRYGRLRVLGMRQYLPLDYIYTSVQFLENPEYYNWSSRQDLEAFYQSYSQKLSPNTQEREDGLNVANDNQYLMVLGAPGSGKSTFLRKIGLEALQGKQGQFKHDCIPVFLELKRFKPNDNPIRNWITQDFQSCGFPQPENLTKRLLDQGKLLILLDGLDEVSTKQLDTAIKQIQDFVKTYPDNRFIASCRTAAYYQRFSRFKTVEIAEFDDNQIQQFIYNWFQSEEDIQSETAQTCWQRVQEEVAVKELAKTPLLLTFLCLVYDRAQAFPSNRSTLYQKALRILLEEWSAEKRIHREEIYQGLNTDLEEILLAEIAYEGFAADRLFFSRQELIDKIREFLENNLNAPQHLESENILQAIEVKQGILVERVRDAYSFSHLTLQEYLTAKYIDDHRLIEKLAAEHLIDERWYEVFLLVAGLMKGGADELLLLMEKEAQKCINTPRLQALLRWAEQETDDSESDLKPVAKRAIAIGTAIAIVTASHKSIDTQFEILNLIGKIIFTVQSIFESVGTTHLSFSPTYIFSRRVIPLSRIIDVTVYLAKELNDKNIFVTFNLPELIDKLNRIKNKIMQQTSSPDVDNSFCQSFVQTWFQAFNLSPELLQLFTQEIEEIEAFSNYFYANFLMVRCKESAVRVSPKTWAAIEERMLRFPGDG